MARLVRVTEVLSRYANLPSVPHEVLLEAAERGTEVHSWCEMYLRGIPMMRPVPASLEGYYESFMHWVDNYVEEVLMIEEELQIPEYDVICHVDFVARIKGDANPAVWDWKTPQTESKVWRAQCAAYLKAVQRVYPEADRYGAVMLQKDGSPPKVREYRDHGRDWLAFLNALSVHRYFSS